MKETPSNAKGGFTRKIRSIVVKYALNRLAHDLCLGVSTSKEAGDEILYGLPGIFTMEISAADESVRIIKEANTLRTMKTSEASDVLLRIKLEDIALLGDIVGRECTLQKAFAEGRMTFIGETKHLATILRAGAAGDKAILPNEEYFELYGKKKED